MSDTLRASYDRLRESSWYSGSGPVEEEPPAMPPAETDPEAEPSPGSGDEGVLP